MLSLLGIAIVAGIWQWATWHLYSLPSESIAAFTSITTNALYSISAIVIFMVTGRLVYEWKNQTVQSTVETAEHVFENRKEDITERMFNCDKLDPKDLDEEAFG